MSNITYRQMNIMDIDSIALLYNDVEWIAYTSDLDRLLKAFENSLFAYAAYDEDVLVGLVRVVGDGLTIIYIQDLLVLNAYQRQGIATHLLNIVLDQYKDVRQKLLLTDDEEKTRMFYESVGFKDVNDIGAISFIYF